MDQETAPRTLFQHQLQAMIEAFTTLDLDWAYRHIPSASCFNATELLEALHMARYECPHVAEVLRIESRQWLESRGLQRLFGAPWPHLTLLP